MYLSFVIRGRRQITPPRVTQRRSALQPMTARQCICELNKVNPFDYVTELLRHPAEMAVRPAEWMPWNYRRDATVAAA